MGRTFVWQEGRASTGRNGMHPLFGLAVAGEYSFVLF